MDQETDQSQNLIERLLALFAGHKALRAMIRDGASCLQWYPGKVLQGLVEN